MGSLSMRSVMMVGNGSSLSDMFRGLITGSPYPELYGDDLVMGITLQCPRLMVHRQLIMVPKSGDIHRALR